MRHFTIEFSPMELQRMSADLARVDDPSEPSRLFVETANHLLESVPSPTPETQPVPAYRNG